MGGRVVRSRTDPLTDTASPSCPGFPRPNAIPGMTGPFVALLSVTLLWNSSDCRADDAKIPVWHLTPGQRFTVQSETHRVTEIQVGDTQTVSDITDRLSLQYSMLRSDSRNAAHLVVRIQSMQRTIRTPDGTETTQKLVPELLLREPEVTITVSDRGRAVMIQDAAAMFRTDVPQTYRAIARMSRDGVLESWFDLPFRIPVRTDRLPFGATTIRQSSGTDETPAVDPPDDSILQADTAWQRSHSLALGLAAVVRTECQYQVESIEDQQAQIRVSGVPDVTARSAGDDAPLQFLDVQLTASELSGSGHFRTDELSGLPVTIRMSTQQQLEGTSTVKSGEQAHEMRFKQSLTQTWIASEFALPDIRRGVPLVR